MKILVVNGPNLNFLGIRDKSQYGENSYEYLCEKIKEKADELGLLVEFYQSNIEGEIINKLQKAYKENIDGIIINPGAYTHYSYALFDAIKSISIPTVEVHLSNIHEREEFRKISVTASACIAQIYGKGKDGYVEAVELLLKR